MAKCDSRKSTTTYNSNINVRGSLNVSEAIYINGKELNTSGISFKTVKTYEDLELLKSYGTLSDSVIYNVISTGKQYVYDSERDSIDEINFVDLTKYKKFVTLLPKEELPMIGDPQTIYLKPKTLTISRFNKLKQSGENVYKQFVYGDEGYVEITNITDAELQAIEDFLEDLHNRLEDLSTRVEKIEEENIPPRVDALESTVLEQGLSIGILKDENESLDARVKYLEENGSGNQGQEKEISQIEIPAYQVVNGGGHYTMDGNIEVFVTKIHYTENNEECEDLIIIHATYMPSINKTDLEFYSGASASEIYGGVFMKEDATVNITYTTII